MPPQMVAKKTQTTAYDAPWTAQAEVEVRRRVEGREALLVKKVSALREKLRVATAALGKQKNSVQFLDRRSRHFRKQARIMRKFIERWDERNWGDLTSTALRGSPKDVNEKDHTTTLLKSAAMAGARKAFAEEVREDSRKHLETHAFRVEKMIARSQIQNPWVSRKLL